MYLVLAAALIAACGADKLDRNYLPPASASTAGGSPGSLQTPFKSFNQGLGGFPKGGYSNEFEGIVVDAAAAGTRASGPDETGLGGPRISYGSTDSKVGEAAFTADTAFPRVGVHYGLNKEAGLGTNQRPNFGLNKQGVSGSFGAFHTSPEKPERIQASRDRASNTVKYENDVSHDRFNYAFETDNGITAQEIGVEVNGVNAEGGYSYTGDDGQVYSVTYTADEGGYQPRGDHLPTPPPIPAEILKSLEQNAKEEALGVVDDGSYDAQKYNTGDDYTKSDSSNGKYNGGQPTRVINRPQSDADASGSFISQNNQALGRPSSNVFGSTPIKAPTIAATGFESFDSSKYAPSTGNNFGILSSAEKTTQQGQTGFDSGSNNQYLPPTSGFYRTRGHIVNNKSHGTQSTPGLRNNAGAYKSNNAQFSSSIPISQQNLQEDRAKKTHSIPVFGKPVAIDSNISTKDPSEPFVIGSDFELMSINVTSKNGYIPPRIFGQTKLPFGFQYSQYKDQQSIPIIDNDSPRQLSESTNSRSANDQFQNSKSISNLNKAPDCLSQFKSSSLSSQSPTLQPQRELTTPFESNSDRNKGSVPVPIIDGPDSPSIIGSSILPPFGSRSSNNLYDQTSFNTNQIKQVAPIPALPKPGSNQSNLGGRFSNRSPVDVQYSSSTQRPSFNKLTQQQSSDDSYYYNTPSKPFNTPTARPQVSSFNQANRVTQTAFTTRPQSSANSQTPFAILNNNPSNPTIEPTFSTPTSQLPELNGNKFQSQFNKVTQASASSFSSAIPTASTHFHKDQVSQFSTTPTQGTNIDLHQSNKGPSSSFNQFGSSFSQAAYTPEFPPNGQESIHKLSGVANSDSTPATSSQYQQTQQYNGEIYEYNKPQQVPQVPQKSNLNGPLQTQSQQEPRPSFFGSSALNSPQNTQVKQDLILSTMLPNQQHSGSGTFGQFSSQPSKLPQDSKIAEGNQAFNLNSEKQNQPQSELRPAQLGPLSKPSLGSQSVQGASKFPPAYNNQGPPCCKQNGFGSSSQTDQGETLQFGGQSGIGQNFGQKEPSTQETRPGQSVSSFVGIPESFGGPRKPPSFDDTGYHY